MNVLSNIRTTTDKANDLSVDFSELLHYPSQLLISSWSKGIRWFLYVDDTEEQGAYYQEAPLPLSFVLANPDYKAWFQSIPEPVLRRLGPYSNSEYTLLYLCSHYPAAYDLFVSAPTLLWLLVQQARLRQWPEHQIEALCRQKRTHIMQACGLPAKRVAVNLLSRLDFKTFGQVELADIRKLFRYSGYEKLSHVRRIDERLLQLIATYPKLIGSCLVSAYRPESWNHQSRCLIEDCERMAAQLVIHDMMQRLGRCKDHDQLQRLHDRLVGQINRRNRSDLPYVRYRNPPFTGTEHIVPITSSTELMVEGREQRNCVASYHPEIFNGRYYMYRITHPQRATLGLTLKPGYKPQLDQLKGFQNQPVSEQTSQTVLTWLAQELETYGLPEQAI